ncbi:MAG: gliding motility protein GldM [Muribaculaceae bacterium]|nr:gliding motility protein GldM [Muribaculaceae bacterium]
MNSRLTPRQKMINLMYIVLTAMLALNVSSDVLDGFSDVEKGVRRSTENAVARNSVTLGALESFAERNPEKGRLWYDQAREVTSTADSLCRIIDSLKLAIVVEADGKNGDVENIVSQEDLEASSVVMLNPLNPEGYRLKEGLDRYREMLTESLKNDSLKSLMIASLLSTDEQGGNGWVENKFENKPVIAAVTLLSQIQNDVRTAEGETLTELLDKIDAGDVRVNQLDAFVLPRSEMVMRGSPYHAEIVLAAVDSTERPVIRINGKELPTGSNIYETIASGSGRVEYSGSLTVPHPDGSYTEHPFRGAYTVLDPMATVSATMMNVLYAGIDNPISISVPGVPASAVSATITNGTLTRSGNMWIARPASVGKDAEITVSAEIDGRRNQVATHKFKVRKLPDPSPFISYTDAQGNLSLYRGGRSLPKNQLLSSPGIEAAIDDELLNIRFTVNSFETVFFDSMGNAMVEVSDGPRFSQRQKDSFRRLTRGKRFYITKVKATGPDGITRDISPLEVIVN